MTVLAVLQPNYLPWRGTFDMIDRADVFVILDDVQYTRNDWRNRNRVRQPDGRMQWLSVPVQSALQDRILDVRIDYARGWRAKHLRTLAQCYGRTLGFRQVDQMLRRAFDTAPARLVDLTIPLTIEIARILGTSTQFLRASEMGITGDRNERLVAMAQAVGAQRYLTGPAARSYLDERLWAQAGIALDWMDYPAYPPYGPAGISEAGEASIVEVLCHTGPDAPRHIWPDAQRAALPDQTGAER